MPFVLAHPHLLFFTTRATLTAGFSVACAGHSASESRGLRRLDGEDLASSGVALSPCFEGFFKFGRSFLILGFFPVPFGIGSSTVDAIKSRKLLLASICSAVVFSASTEGFPLIRDGAAIHSLLLVRTEIAPAGSSASAAEDCTDTCWIALVRLFLLLVDDFGT